VINVVCQCSVATDLELCGSSGDGGCSKMGNDLPVVLPTTAYFPIPVAVRGLSSTR